MEKVYCKNCKWYFTKYGDPYGIPEYLCKKDPKEECNAVHWWWVYSDVLSKNKLNDCKDWEEKLPKLNLWQLLKRRKK